MISLHLCHMVCSLLNYGKSRMSGLTREVCLASAQTPGSIMPELASETTLYAVSRCVLDLRLVLGRRRYPLQTLCVDAVEEGMRHVRADSPASYHPSTAVLASQCQSHSNWPSKSAVRFTKCKKLAHVAYTTN